MSEVESTALLTLNNQTAILADTTLAMTRGGRLLSVRGSSSIQQVTAGDGPWLTGLCQKGVTLSLLTEFLENQGPLSPSDVDKSEQARRGSRIRTLGILTPSGNGTVAGTYWDNVSLSGLRFTEEVAGWAWWLYNLGQQMTTAAIWTSAVQLFVQFNPSG